MKAAVDTFEVGLRSGDLLMCVGDTATRAPVARWHDRLGPAELSVISRSRGPVLDVGCGPGRMVGRLLEDGVDALGVDVSQHAVDLTRGRGGEAVLGDVFSLDLASRYRTILLLDGNIGIGGDPAALLSRLRDLLADGGHIVCEVEDPLTPSERSMMFLRSGTEVSKPFPWAVLSLSDAQQVAARSDLRVLESWTVPEPGALQGSRFFVTFSK